MVGVRYKSDKRDQYLQHGGWFVKIGLWLLFNILPFFFPVSFVNGYGAPSLCMRASSTLTPGNPLNPQCTKLVRLNTAVLTLHEVCS